MRYFLVGYSFRISSVFTFGMIGHSREGFPTLADVKDEIKRENPKAEKISIISLTELAEQDYKTYWSKVNDL